MKDRTLRAEIYQKNYARLTTFDRGQPFNPAAYQNAGSGYARGATCCFGTAPPSKWPTIG